MSLGFEQAGFDVALGVELDGYHVATHERNFPYGKSLCRSVSDLTADIVFEAVGTSDVDLICGGPPCQGFSHMGQRDALDPRNSLVSQFVRVVGEVKPRAFVMENVPGMLTGEARSTLDNALNGFEKAGYRITHPCRVLDASAFGVPQKRKRLIVIGIRRDLGEAATYPSRAASGIPSIPTVWEAIADLPDVDELAELFNSNNTVYSDKPKNNYSRTMRGLLDDPHDFSYRRIWDKKKCSGCLRVRHTPSAIALYERTKPGEMVPSHKLPRLDPNGLAPTLRAGSDSSHGSYTAPRPIHPFRPRCITAREAARLHGFPDWFAFYPSKWHAYRQIGNAVCPPLARAIGHAIIQRLGYVPSVPKVMMALSDEYRLPEDRPRTRKRLPQVVHYPPVIEALFADRFDRSRGILRNPGFTFGDVIAAVESTGVELNGVRADTFLGQIARSRNVNRLLDPCLKYGFTIRLVNGGERIGEFVPAGHPDGIRLKVVAPRDVENPTLPRSRSRGQKTLC
jgi:DNA (cytosine-5)-methyltransferase 1